MKKIKIASAEYFIKFITSEMNSPHKNDKKFAQMFVLPDFFFYDILIDLHPSIILRIILLDIDPRF